MFLYEAKSDNFTHIQAIFFSDMLYVRKNIFACLFSVHNTIILSRHKQVCLLLCKPKDRVATQDKNNIVYEIDCSNCKAVYFGESKRSLKLRSDEHKRSVRNCDCDKNEIAKHCWEADHNFN